MRLSSPLVIIFITVFLYLVGFGVIIPIVPMLSRDFGATPLQVGLLLSCYSLMQFLFSPFWGKLSDRMGRRPILLVCLFGEGLAYILFGLANNLVLLFVARLIAGFFGASLSTASAYISDVTSPQERSKGLGLIGAAFGLGFIVGPAMGGGLAAWGETLSSAPHFGTSFAAYCVSGLYFLNFLFAVKKLKETLKDENRAKLEPRTSRLAGLIKEFKKPVIGSLMGVFGLASLAMAAMEATLVLLVEDRFAWGIKEVSFGFAYLGVIIVLTQGFLVRKVIPLWGERKVLSIGLVGMSIGLSGIAVSYEISVLAIFMTILAIGNGLINPSIMGSISLLTSANKQGANLGLTQSMASLGRIIGPGFGGLLYGSLSQSSPFLFAGGLAAFSLLIVLNRYALLPESGKLAVAPAVEQNV